MRLEPGIEICFVGMSRSGNHAIINWLLSLFPRGEVAFMNNVGSKKNAWKVSIGLPNVPKYTGEGSPKVVAYSFENKTIETAWRRVPRASVRPKKKFYLCVVLRDPFNLFASRIALRDRHNAGAERWQNTSVIWKNHALSFLGHLGVSLDGMDAEGHYLPISYNSWFSDEEYRRAIADRFNVQYSERALSRVPPQGNGSSFDSRVFDGNANEMAVFDRWRGFIDRDCYLELFDSQVFLYSRKIFGQITGAEAAVREARKSRLNLVDP